MLAVDGSVIRQLSAVIPSMSRLTVWVGFLRRVVTSKQLLMVLLGMLLGLTVVSMGDGKSKLGVLCGLIAVFTLSTALNPRG